MDGCVGRAKELSFLEDLWEKAPVACAVCGRRHLGKTALLKEFTKDKRHLYLAGTGGLCSDNLMEINRALSNFSGKEERITDMIDLFPRIVQLCGKQKVVVIIDRFSDLTENFDEVSSYLRNFMNRDLNGTRIMLVVCDSDNSVFGRFYYTLELKPMNYLECRGFHPGYSARQQMMAYALVGGTPAYHRLFKGMDPEEVIRTQMFDHMSVFSLEAEGLISSEALTVGSCNKILAAMAAGAENVRDISSRTNISTSYCTKMLEDLEHKGILLKEVSSGMSRRAVYSISSNIIRFYYQVVYRYTHMVEFESPDEAYAAAAEDIQRYMERSFKTVCMDYVTANFDYKFVGRLRRRDDSLDRIVDFLASVRMDGSERTLIARCRLDGAVMDRHDLDDLVERGRKIDGPSKMYYLFSGCGFAQDLSRYAESSGGDVNLVTLEEIYR